MTGPEVLDVARDALWTLIVVSAPPMLLALVIGFGISLMQALTQIQEMTLTFVPKMLAIFVALLLLFPLMGQSMSGLWVRLLERVVTG
jgi:flagellar biosynthesis protein FliQ